MDEITEPSLTSEPPLPTPLPAAEPRVVSSGRRRRQQLVAVVAIIFAAAFLLTLKINGDRERAAAEGPPRPPMNASELQQFSTKTGYELIDRYRGEAPAGHACTLVEHVGASLVAKSDAHIGTITYHFHLLAEPDTINIFALPDGNVYVTTAFVNRMQTEGQLAAGLSQAIAHVMMRDVLNRPDADPAAPTVTSPWRFTTKEELASDKRAVKLMAQAGYDPNALIGMYTILTNAYTAGANVEFFTTHPNTVTRMQVLADTITAMYPYGTRPSSVNKLHSASR